MSNLVWPFKIQVQWNRAPLLANDVFRLLVGSQPQENRLTKLAVMGPLGKLDLGNKHRLDPLAAFHHRRSDP